MKITYVTTYDATDVNNWSGSGHYVAQALRNQNFQLDFVGPLPRPLSLWPVYKTKSFIYNRLLKARYHANHDHAIAKHYARLVDEHVRQTPECDLIFSPGTIPIAYLKTDKPTVFWSDATHAALFDFYPEYTHLCAETIRDGHAIERRAMERSSAAIFTSEWAASSAINYYGIDPAKTHVVPFGANIENPPSPAEVHSAIAARPQNLCKLLFIGIDWERKGGEIALAVAEELNRMGLRTELTIVGCNPFTQKSMPDFVRCEGFLSKRSQSQRDHLSQLISESHFLIVPSFAECYGLVYCEANAFGVPSLARAVGGVTTVIRDGYNGQTFSIDAPSHDYTSFIAKMFEDYPAYIEFAHSSHQEYLNRLNWNVAGRRVRDILQNVTHGNTSLQTQYVP